MGKSLAGRDGTLQKRGLKSRSSLKRVVRNSLGPEYSGWKVGRLPSGKTSEKPVPSTCGCPPEGAASIAAVSSATASHKSPLLRPPPAMITFGGDWFVPLECGKSSRKGYFDAELINKTIPSFCNVFYFARKPERQKKI